MQPLSEDALDEIVARERELGIRPLTDWDTLSDRLRAEGLLKDPPMARFRLSAFMRIAAGLVLAAGGVVAGRMTAGVPPVPANAGVETSASQARLASATSGVQQFESPEQAWEVLNRAGEEYQRASAYLAEVDNEVVPPPSTDQFRTRLAALDNVMSQMRDAMREAPQDPVINQYYLATAGAREATLRQLGTVLPASARMNRF